MTPRERDTLDMILRDVEKCAGKTANGARIDRVFMLDKHHHVVGGDYLIGKVDFRPTGARCA